MKILVSLLGAMAPFFSLADDWTTRYSADGELIVTQMVSAPFPHPQRAQGHKYKDQTFSAQENYSDGTVAIFIPRGLREGGTVDLVIHFHGWKNNVRQVLEHYKLIEQLMASQRNAILVVPQGPKNASDSFGGKLEDRDGFKRFMDEVMAMLRARSGLKRKDFGLGKVILSGHSGGYEVMSAIVDRGGLSDHIREVWLFDALYAQTERFLAWYDREHGRLLDIYTDHGGTKDLTEKLMATLKERGAALCAGEEGKVAATEMQSHSLVFLHTTLAHDDVLEKNQTFQRFLETSCLEARPE